jgi:hypothetical protein
VGVWYEWRVSERFEMNGRACGKRDRVMRDRGDIPSCEAKWTFFALVRSISSV